MLARLAFYWLAALLLAACHDSPRNNPVDPDLTPAVQIVDAQVDAVAGSARIEWQPYSGTQVFAAYRLQRRERGVVAVDTLVQIAAQSQTSYIDTTLEPDQDYVYQVVVINRSGFEVPGLERIVGSFGVEGVRLSAPIDDTVAGHITLRWQAFHGPRFEAYQVWRRSFGQENEQLGLVGARDDTTFVDQTAIPRIQYTYWVSTQAAGLSLDSEKLEGTLRLPSVNLTQVSFSSQLATAQLTWEQYQGPRFVRYEVRRQSGQLAEQTVQSIADLSQTSFVDSVLDGNTAYTYRVRVVTAWEGVEIDSNQRKGAFYELVDDWQLPLESDSEVWSLALSFDQMDQLYVGSTQKLTTTADQMQTGIRIQWPGENRYRSFFSVQPHRLSPVFLHVEDELIIVAVRSANDQLFVGAIQDARPIWNESQPNNGENPIGIYTDPADTDKIAVVDGQGMIYRFDSQTGAPDPPSDDLEKTLFRNSLPVNHLAVGKGAGLAGLDQFFLLAPDRSNNHIIAKTLITSGIFAGERAVFDDGVGLENGQTLVPQAMAFDAFHTRLVVVELDGRMQIFDGRAAEISPRYITKWGSFGEELGQFSVSPPTAVAVAVDSQGRIHVADGGGVAGRVQVFAP